MSDWIRQLDDTCPVGPHDKVETKSETGALNWGAAFIFDWSEVKEYRLSPNPPEWLSRPEEPAQPAEFIKSTANATQVAGDHYKSRSIQPWDYIAANNLGYFEGNVVKYVSRWQDKGGIEDLKKARHYLDKLIELRSGI